LWLKKKGLCENWKKEDWKLKEVWWNTRQFFATKVVKIDEINRAFKAAPLSDNQPLFYVNTDFNKTIFKITIRKHTQKEIQRQIANSKRHSGKRKKRGFHLLQKNAKFNWFSAKSTLWYTVLQAEHLKSRTSQIRQQLTSTQTHTVVIYTYILYKQTSSLKCLFYTTVTKYISTWALQILEPRRLHLLLTWTKPWRQIVSIWQVLKTRRYKIGTLGSFNGRI